MEFGRYMGSCAEPYNYKSHKTVCNRDDFCLIQLDSAYFCVCSQPKRNHDEPGCTGNLFCNITSHKNCSSSCPDGYASNISQNVDGKLTCYPDPRNGPGKNKDILIGLSAALGTLSLSIGAQSLYEFVNRRIANMLKQKFLKKNGGLSLRRMSSNEGNNPTLKFYTENEVKKATDSYNEIRILGQGGQRTGGQGTVYKGMLEEGRIIAVKRLQKVDESKVDVFIKEVVILSQINHTNVVQLLGCCLETEVPLLVYEFIPNGTLFDYIHEQNEEFPLTWDRRLRIAIEVADVLSYLHSAAPEPIYHGDINSSNILLDEKYRAKVSNIGTSRSIPVDQTHLIENTPDRSSQFTEKNDVYNFGVVLAELLIGQKPIQSTDSEEANGLASYFLQVMEEDCPFEIFDARVFKDDRQQEIETFANLTRRCLDSNESKRPTMEEVATELEGIRTSNGALISKQNRLEIKFEINCEAEIGCSSLSDCCCSGITG